MFYPKGENSADFAKQNGFKQQLPKHSKAVFSESEDSGGQVPRYKIGAVSLYGVLTRVCMRKPSRPSGFLPAAKSHSRFA